MNRLEIGIFRMATCVCGLLLAPSVSGSLLSAQTTLTITSPKEGTVFNAGETIHVTVEVRPLGAFVRTVIIIGEDPMGFSDSRPSPPFEFSLKIPADTDPGRYHITADAITEPQQEATSRPVEIQVEHSGTPLSLRAEFEALEFQFVGDECPVGAIGQFEDADHVYLDRSRYTTYTSSAPRIAKVTTDGHVVAVAPGTARIIVGYKGVSAVVPVKVRRPPADR